MDITEMVGHRVGRLGVCTQPLFTHRAWLKDWVDYQFLIGADEVIMHLPKVSAVSHDPPSLRLLDSASQSIFKPIYESGPLFDIEQS